MKSPATLNIRFQHRGMTVYQCVANIRLQIFSIFIEQTVNCLAQIVRVKTETKHDFLISGRVPFCFKIETQ